MIFRNVALIVFTIFTIGSTSIRPLFASQDGEIDPDVVDFDIYGKLPDMYELEVIKDSLEPVMACEEDETIYHFLASHILDKNGCDWILADIDLSQSIIYVFYFTEDKSEYAGVWLTYMFRCVEKDYY